jgi:hypothetical protein
MSIITETKIEKLGEKVLRKKAKKVIDRVETNKDIISEEVYFKTI